MLAAIPGLVSVGQSAVSAASSLFGGGGGVDNLKNNVWAKVPFALRRIAGGSGKWHDTVTGESGNDQWGDVRAVAVIAPALGGYVDSNGVLYDNATAQPLTREQAWQRWLQAFGNIGFAQAFAQNPAAFHPYGPNPADDPTIGKAAPKPASGPLAPAQAYVAGQVQSVVTAAKDAASNIAGVATGAASGAVTGANSPAYVQSVTSSPLLWAGIAAVVLVVVVVISKKRG